MSYEQKVRVAQELESKRKSLARLNHMAANPKDIYLYLFQIVLSVFVSFSFGLLFVLIGPVYYPPAVLFFILGFILFIAGIVDARNMSAKHIGEVRSKLQKQIDEAIVKLNLPLSHVETQLDAVDKSDNPL